VAAVVSRGSKLLSISRQLRNIHDGAKVYLVGAQVTRANSELRFFRSNLVQTKERSNRFIAYAQIATGGGLHEAFTAEKNLLNSDSELRKLLKLRYETLQGTTAGEAANPFTTSFIRGSAALSLRKDFVYWEPGYAEGPQHAPLVLLTIGEVLQRARDGKFEKDEHRLATDVFQQVVIEPQLFTRYNEGIIQSSFLRQAYAAELDYSSTPECSHLMRRVIEEQVQFRTAQQGEAALEFALALRTGRLKLTQADHEAVTSFASTQLGKSLLDQALRRLFSDPLASRVSSF
jgi:hypothetical protein